MRESGRNLMFSYGGEIESVGNLNSEGGSFEVGVEGGKRDWKKIEGKDDQNGKTMTMDVPIADISENKDVVMEDLGDEGWKTVFFYVIKYGRVPEENRSIISARKRKFEVETSNPSVRAESSTHA